jgi:hypothetical protein
VEINNKRPNLQQQIIDLCSELGLDSSNFMVINPESFKLQVVYHGLRDGIDLGMYLEKFDCEQLEEIRLAKKSGLDITQIAIVELSSEQMMMKRISLEHHVSGE